MDDLSMKHGQINLSFLDQYSYKAELLSHWEQLVSDICSACSPHKFSIITFGSIVSGSFSYDSSIRKTCSDYELNVVFEDSTLNLDSLNKNVQKIASRLGGGWFLSSPLFDIDIRCLPISFYDEIKGVFTYTYEFNHCVYGADPIGAPRITPNLSHSDLLLMYYKDLLSILIYSTKPKLNLEIAYLINKLALHCIKFAETSGFIQLPFSQRQVANIKTFDRDLNISRYSESPEMVMASLSGLLIDIESKFIVTRDEVIPINLSEMLEAIDNSLQKKLPDHKVLKLVQLSVERFYSKSHPRRAYYLKLLNIS